MRTAALIALALSLAAPSAAAQTSTSQGGSTGGATSTQKGAVTPGSAAPLTQGTTTTTGQPDSQGDTGQTDAGRGNATRVPSNQKKQIEPNSQTSSGATRTETRTGGNPARDTIADCLKLWEPATHMSRADWQRTCRRVQDRLNQATN